MRSHILTGSPFEADIGYARACICDGWVFVSGTTGYDYKAMILPVSVEDQCANALATISAALQQAHSGLHLVTRVRYILTDAADFPRIWPQTSAAFGVAKPAATMLVAGLMQPEMKIEIEVTARQAGVASSEGPHPA
jgi:enamine deaminase RidA (YjgF/YER057c/UK114 family)